MKFVYSRFGSKKKGDRALYIAMHGGGETLPIINDQQWNNHKNLYQPEEGIYFVPRSPTNSWNMWHQGYMDPFIEQIIEMAIIKEGVNPNKVYIMGFSAGGDGTYQLAPRVADLWAAAAMSAGHPGDAQIDSLYNLPFGLYMGGQDSPYDRNKFAMQWEKELDTLAQQNHGAYIHQVRIFPQYGHWMKLEDAMSMKWIPTFKRNPIPKKVVWVQDDVLRERFCWLQVDSSEVRQGDKIVASYKGNVITIEESDVANLSIGLNDEMLNLNKPVRLMRGKKLIFEGIVPHLPANIQENVDAMRDMYLVFPAKLRVQGDSASVVVKE